MGGGVHKKYIYIYKSTVFLEPIFYLSKYLLSELYFNTDRLLIKFNGLWYSLAARQVFVAIANPDSLSFGKESPTPETHIAPNHTPTIADTVPKWLNTPTLLLASSSWPLVTTRQAGGYLDLEGSAWCTSGQWTLGLKTLAYSRIDLSLHLKGTWETQNHQTFCVSLVLVSFTLIYRAACP